MSLHGYEPDPEPNARTLAHQAYWAARCAHIDASADPAVSDLEVLRLGRVRDAAYTAWRECVNADTQAALAGCFD